MNTQTQYWIVVASKDHLERGLAGGFMQANHGKRGPLKRLDEGDWIIFYSPKTAYENGKPLQAFTAIGKVKDGEIYQHKMDGDFNPYRRNMEFYQAEETPIAPLIDDLDFIENKTSWGYKFRFGFFEIGEQDFTLIKTAMIKGKLILTDKI
jgi:predicted RNA-binding protein